MELKAVIEALEGIKELAKPFDRFKILTDSTLITKYNQHGQGRKNRDLVDKLVQLNKHYKSLQVHIEYIWIKGHSGIKWNEFVDDLAGVARLHQTGELDSIPKEFKYKIKRRKIQRAPKVGSITRLDALYAIKFIKENKK